MERETEREDEQLDLYRKLDSTKPEKENQFLLVITIKVLISEKF